MALYDPRIRNLMKYKIFIHCDSNGDATQVTSAYAEGSFEMCRIVDVPSRVFFISTTSS